MFYFAKHAWLFVLVFFIVFCLFYLGSCLRPPDELETITKDVLNKRKGIEIQIYPLNPDKK